MYSNVYRFEAKFKTISVLFTDNNNEVIKSKVKEKGISF